MSIKNFTTAIFIVLSARSLSQEITVRGIVFDIDSITPMPYAYAVNKNSSVGTVADETGKFSLRIHTGDTLCFSYLGYSVTKIYTHQLKDSIRNHALNVSAYLKQKANELKPVIVAAHSFSKEARELFEGRINEYHRGVSSLFGASRSGAALNLDALYYMWSKKGKELQKLSVLYQQLLIEEIKEQRLSSEKIRTLTGNDSLDVKDFLNSCFLPEQFVVSASDYDLFVAVKNCYRMYLGTKREKE